MNQGVSLVRVHGNVEVQHAPDKAEFSAEFLNQETDGIDVYDLNGTVYIDLGTLSVYTYQVVDVLDEETVQAVLVDKPE